MKRLHDVSVIIRSVGERTEELCKKLILDQGIPQENLFVINEKPFSKAMKVGYQLGIDQDLSWTYIIDADVLLRENAIIDMVKAIEQMPDNTLGISGELLDKLMGRKRTAGNHLFCTEYLHLMIKAIQPYEKENIRPESTIIKRLKKNGLFFEKNKKFIGLHDFEQHYHDIARKAFIHSKKHIEHISDYIQFWQASLRKDQDFRAALFGLSRAINHTEGVKININDFTSLHEEVIEVFEKKSNLISDFEIQSFTDVEKKMNKKENRFFLDERFEKKYRKQFRRKFNEITYRELLRSIAGKIKSDVKKKLKFL